MISSKIKQLLKERRMSVLQLASKINISQRTIYNYFKANAFIPLSNLEKIANAFEIPISYFFQENDKEKQLKTLTEKFRATGKNRNNDHNSEVREFLSGLTDRQFRYLRQQINFATKVRELIADFDITKERFCELMDIDESDYVNFRQGGYQYTVDNMVDFEIAYWQLKKEQQPIVKI